VNRSRSLQFHLVAISLALEAALPAATITQVLINPHRIRSTGSSSVAKDAARAAADYLVSATLSFDTPAVVILRRQLKSTQHGR
jgi:hypothetical protein